MNRVTFGILALMLSALYVHGDASFVFSNFGENGSPIAPVYGPEPGNPNQQKWGNTPSATPPGTQSYSGMLLDGTNFYVEAWYSLTPILDTNGLGTTMTELPPTLTSFLPSPVAGFFDFGNIAVPGSVYGGTIYVQARAWDNNGGQLNSWDAAWDAAQNGSGLSVGWSQVFPQLTGGFGASPPGTYNFESFNTFIVPEPSSLALLGLSTAALLVSRWQKQTTGKL